MENNTRNPLVIKAKSIGWIFRIITLGVGIACAYLLLTDLGIVDQYRMERGFYGILIVLLFSCALLSRFLENYLKKAEKNQEDIVCKQLKKIRAETFGHIMTWFVILCFVNWHSDISLRREITGNEPTPFSLPISTAVLVVLGYQIFMVLLMKLVMNTKELKSKPLEEQEKIRKMFRNSNLLSLIIIIVIFALLYTGILN